MKTTYLRNKILEHITGKTTFTKPTNTFLGLLKSDPTLAGSQTDEVSGGSYARQQVAWGNADGGMIKSGSLIEFENMPAVEIKYWAVFDASTNGNMLYYYPIAIPLKIAAAQDLTINADNLILREV